MTLKIGSVVTVGDFFWIDEGDFIGYDEGALHGHGLDGRSGGSVAKGCELEVRSMSSGHAIVSLDRPEVPHGAPAAIGTVFKISLKRLDLWGESSVELEIQRRVKEELAKWCCK